MARTIKEQVDEQQKKHQQAREVQQQKMKDEVALMRSQDQKAWLDHRKEAYRAKADALWPRVQEARKALNKGEGSSYETFISAIYVIWSSIELDTEHRTLMHAHDWLSGSKTGPMISLAHDAWKNHFHPKHLFTRFRSGSNALDDESQTNRVQYGFELTSDNKMDVYFGDEAGKIPDSECESSAKRLAILLEQQLNADGYELDPDGKIIPTSPNDEPITREKFADIANKVHQDLENKPGLKQSVNSRREIQKCEFDISEKMSASLPTPRPR